MDPLTTSAASGMQARLQALDLLANNLANAASAGYKADREFYGVYRSAEAASGGSASSDAVADRNWTDFSAGPLAPTGNASDLAIAGRGFFVVSGPAGPLYTRNGNFRVSPSGTLETQDGYAVQAAGGGKLQLAVGEPFDIDVSGEVRQGGNSVGRIAIVDFARPDALGKAGQTYFRLADPNLIPSAANAEVRQRTLEAANFSPAEAAVRLVAVLRQFEMLQKAMQLGSEMNRHAVEEVARVS